MENKFWVSRNSLFHVVLLCLLLLLLLPFSNAQLTPAETRSLFQVQQLLEYPPVLQGWNNWTNFCYLPQSPSLVIVCSENHVTELTVVGNRTSPSDQLLVSHQALSEKFSIDLFFTVLTQLSNLKVLTVVSLGLWGPLPAKINRFRSLEVLNISSNFIYGEIPPSMATLMNLKNLVMADNLFNGTVPDLKNLRKLEDLDLSNNHLGPKFPSLNNNLSTIKLGNNSLRSDIPPDLIKFNALQLFDVSSNRLLGPIPNFLFSLPSIQYLNLAKNQLSGALPTNVSCKQNLVFVDVSNNLLMGKLPSCLVSRSSNSNRTVLSSWNCLNGGSKDQHPYSFCHKEALAVKPPTKDQDHEGESTIKLGLVLGIIGGIIVVVGGLGLLILGIYRRVEAKKAKEEFKSESFVFEKNQSVVRAFPVVDGRNFPRRMRSAMLGLPPYHVYTLEEIEDATNNFDSSNLVGDGAQGQLYKGWLGDGSLVLVKCLKLRHKHSPLSLQQHVEVMSKLRHRHLVSVLGHCIVTYQDHHPNTASTVFIVLEHVPNGSLRHHLTDWRKREVLKWPQRMGITMGIARGIQFLHTGVGPCIFGSDLNIDNILLDETLTPKISSYNISLPSKVGSESPLNGQDAITHFGSENPEKEDIYQLGVILIEVITGKPINSGHELHETKQQLEMSLTEAPSKLQEVADPMIHGTFAYDSLKTAVKITVNCLCDDSSKRPSIEDVLWHMQYSVQVQEGWTSSGNLGLGTRL